MINKFQNSEEFKSTKINPLAKFWKLVALEKVEIVNIYAFAALSGLIYLSLPLGIQSIINYLYSGLISTSLVVLIFIVILGVFANGWLQIIQMKIIERISRRVFTRFSMAYAAKIPKLDLASIDNNYLPELVNRFFDTATLQKGISKILLEFPTAMVQILFGLALLAAYNPNFLVVSLLVTLLIYLIMRFTYPKGMATSIEESNYKYEVGYWLEELGRTIKSFKFMGVYHYPLIKTDGLVSSYLDSREDHFRILKIQYWSFIFFKVIISAALLILGVVLIIDEQINLGQFIAAEIIILTIINSIEKLIGSLDVVYDMLTALEKVSGILEKPEEKDQSKLLIDEKLENGMSIKLENLSFSFDYNNPVNVLNNISLTINSGEKICIFGSEGSGKTTILKMLTGAYTNFDGQILINDLPIGNYNLQKLRQNIGIYLDSPDLFSGTLYENLTMGNEYILPKTILNTAKETGLINYIQTLPNGLDTNVNSIGKNLAKNIVTKILITRALLTNPKLLLLEDCWSNLENFQQELIIKNITSFDKKYTLIAVTNDETFASQCDKILLLEKGNIIRFGTFKEISNTIEYKNMFKNFSK